MGDKIKIVGADFFDKQPDMDKDQLLAAIDATHQNCLDWGTQYFRAKGMKVNEMTKTDQIIWGLAYVTKVYDGAAFLPDVFNALDKALSAMQGQFLIQQEWDAAFQKLVDLGTILKNDRPEPMREVLAKKLNELFDRLAQILIEERGERDLRKRVNRQRKSDQFLPTSTEIREIVDDLASIGKDVDEDMDIASRASNIIQRMAVKCGRDLGLGDSVTVENLIPKLQ